MKIIVLLSASLFGFGFAVQSTVAVREVPTSGRIVPATEQMEAPVMDVLLDTLEITAEAPVALTAKVDAPATGVLLDTVEITAVAPRALAANVR